MLNLLSKTTQPRKAVLNNGIYCKSIFDDIGIEIKDGYFYDRHEKFTVDENTVAVTIFFVSENGDEWR